MEAGFFVCQDPISGDNAYKILLGIPFFRAIRFTFNYRPEGRLRTVNIVMGNILLKASVLYGDKEGWEA